MCDFRLCAMGATEKNGVCPWGLRPRPKRLRAVCAGRKRMRLMLSIASGVRHRGDLRVSTNTSHSFHCTCWFAPRRIGCVPEKCRQTCLQLSGMIRTETAYAPTPTCQRWDSNPRLSGLAPGASALDRSAKLSLFTCAQSNG